MLKVFCHYNVLIKVEMKDLKKNTLMKLSINLVRNDEYVKFFEKSIDSKSINVASQNINPQKDLQ